MLLVIHFREHKILTVWTTLRCSFRLCISAKLQKNFVDIRYSSQLSLSYLSFSFFFTFLFPLHCFSCTLLLFLWSVSPSPFRSLKDYPRWQVHIVFSGALLLWPTFTVSYTASTHKTQTHTPRRMNSIMYKKTQELGISMKSADTMIRWIILEKRHMKALLFGPYFYMKTSTLLSPFKNV